MSEDNELPEVTELPLVENLSPKSITEEIEAEVEAEVLAEEANTDSIEQLGEELLELTEEEKRQKFIEAVKASHLRYKPKKHFGTAYKAERKRKNKAQRKSRKLNRK